MGENGGVLVYCGKDIDPYQSVLEWWNTGKYRYSAPAQHLFKLLGMEQNPKTVAIDAVKELSM